MWVRLAPLSISTRGSTSKTSARCGSERRPASALVERDLAGERAHDVAADALEPRRIGDRGAALGVLDAEAVERHAVGGGEDPRVDDAGAARARARPATFMNSPGWSAGVEHDLGARAEAVDAEVDRHRRPPRSAARTSSAWRSWVASSKPTQ